MVQPIAMPGAAAKGFRPGPDRRLFLDVRSSATGLTWEHRLSERQDRTALAMAQNYSIPDIVARILAARGVELEDTQRFLDPTIRDLLPDPLALTDMDLAAERLARAVRARERVAIFGDYDVDGAASAAMVSRFLGHYGVAHEIYIPDRIFEGYGPNPEAMRELVARGASLIVTVDCGINSTPSIAAANDVGADVVVLDHHQVGGALPPAVAAVDPNRADDLSGQGHLCAAGVTFLALVRTARLLGDVTGTRGFDLLSLVDLVAMATVCDVVPLVGVNRAFVAKGLLAIRQQRNEGLAALAKVARLGEPASAYHLSFLLGPRINAGGRIGDAALGSRLLATADPVEARTIAETLDRLNQERQAMEQVMLAEARSEADAELARGDGPAILVTARDSWHPGIVGLIASRLKDHARRPSFAIAFNGSGQGTGSGRSVPGYDLGGLVREAMEQGLLVKGGGHAMAAGITVEKARLGDLRAFFEERAHAEVRRLREDQVLQIDGAISAEGATVDLLQRIDQAGPYGAGYPPPVFALPRHRLVDLRPVGHNHLKLELQSEGGRRVSAMAFRAADGELGAFLLRNRGKPIHVAGSLSANHWNGTTSVQFRVVDAAAA